MADYSFLDTEFMPPRTRQASFVQEPTLREKLSTYDGYKSFENMPNHYEGFYNTTANLFNSNDPYPVQETLLQEAPSQDKETTDKNKLMMDFIDGLFSQVQTKIPDRYKNLTSKIGKMKAMTMNKEDYKTPEVEKPTRGMGGLVGGILNLFDKSYDGTGTRDDSRLYNWLDQRDQDARDFQEAQREKALQDLQLGMDIDKYNQELEQQALSNQLALANQLSRQDINEANMKQRKELAKIKLLSSFLTGNSKEYNKLKEYLDKKIGKDALDYDRKWYDITDPTLQEKLIEDIAKRDTFLKAYK